MAKTQFLNTEKKFKTSKNAISRKKMDLFDFTTFFAWTFLNFLARCPGRKKLNLDKEMTELGLLVSKEGVDICVHQMCVDYAPEMVQDYSTEHGILKIDGYKVDKIKKLRGSKCKYCNKNKAMTPCAGSKKCKGKHALLCLYIHSRPEN